jgi:hypothetical protein
MPDPTPGPGQDDEQAASSPSSQRYLDWQALLDALAAGGLLDGDPDGQDGQDGQDAAGERSAGGDGRVGPALSPGRAGALAVEHMPAGPVQAGWLAAAAAEAGSLDEYGLAGVAIAARRLASWAQAAELAAVARITARAAAADRRIGLAADGRPGRLCRDAVGQVSLALMLTDHAAAGWADLAITLAWRLPATGRALAAGAVDLARARVIAEATGVLSQDAARAVEAEVVPGAGGQTTAQLRVRLRRAVIAADPGAAERRRQDAERQAKVSLYAGEDGTATLTGSGLPAVEAAAAMARVTAIARAMKAAGQGGGLDLHRARVMVGLLLGTLPYIPPPGGAPEPDPPPGSGVGYPGGNGPDGHDPADNGPGSRKPGRSPAATAPDPAPTAAALAAAAPVAGRGTTCPPRGTRTPRATTAPRTPPAAARTTISRTARMTGPGPGRYPRGRAWARSRPRWPAPGPPTGGQHRACWTSPCPGPPWPGTRPRPGCWAASAPSPPPRPAASPAPPKPTRPRSGASSSPTPPGKPSPSPASPATTPTAPATAPPRPAPARAWPAPLLTWPGTARRPAPDWSAASP